MKFSKRILSLILSLLMIVTTIPTFAISTQAAEEVKDKYLFAYFTGNEDVTTTSSENQAVRFAVSADNKSFSVLNSGNPVIKQSKGALNCRDPYIFLGQDGWFYIIATDMKAVSYWGDSKSFVLWRSKDLINWENETIIDISTMLGTTVYRAWAPQVIWDEAQGEYMVYFALAADGYSNIATGNNTHMYYMHTSDLLDASKYSEPKPLIETEYTSSSSDSIDGDITYDNGVYYLFYKNEVTKTICVATSEVLTGPYTGTKVLAKESSESVEGCQVYEDNNGNFYLMIDIYSSNVGTFTVCNLGTSLADFYNSGTDTLQISDKSDQTLSESINSKTPRHGSMLKITTEQYNALLSASSFNTIESASGSGMTSVVGDDIEENNGIDLSSNLLARYFVNDTTTDENSGTYNLTASGSGAQWHDEASAGLGAAYFTPDNYLYTNAISQMFNSVSAEAGITVSFYGNPESSCDAKGRFFELNDKGIKESISWDGNPYNQNNTSYVTMWHSANLEATNNDYNGRVWTDAGEINDEWHQYTVTMNSSQFVVYRDGVQLSSTDSNLFSGILTSLQSTGYLTIGATCWPDPTYTGYMRDFRIYNKAVSADEAKKLYNQYGYDNTYDLEKLKALMAECEAKFANVSSTGVIYANMADAYNAYVNANKFYDAYYYGQQIELADQAEEYAKALDKAINNMVEWTPKTGTARSLYYNDDKPQYYSNVLYSSSTIVWGGNGSGDNASTIKNYDFKFAAPQEVTLLGSRDSVAGFPINMEIVRNIWQTKNRDFYYVGSVTSGLKLVDYWYGFGTDYQSLGTGNSFIIGYDANNQINNGQENFSSPRYVGNKLCADYNALSFNNYLATVQGFKADAYIVDDAVNGQIYNERITVNVIDYQALIDAIDVAFKEIPNDISNYRQGGLSALLNGIQNAQNWDPNSYFTTSNDINGCITAMQSVISNLSTLTTTQDSPGYQAFRDVFDANLSIYSEIFSKPISESVYSEESIGYYSNLRNRGMELMRNVLTSGYNDNDNISAVATAISTDPTQTVLNPKVDTTQLKYAITVANGKYIFEGNEQISTLQSWLDIKNCAENAQTVIANSTGSGKYSTTPQVAGGVDYNKIDVNTLSNQQIAINNETDTLNSMDLVPVDETVLQNFDAAYEVATTVPETMFDPEARAKAMADIEAIRNTIYTTVDNANSQYTPQIPEGFTGDVVLNNADDNDVTEVLTIASNLHDHLAKLTISIFDEVDDSTEEKVLEYGSTLSLEAHEVPGVWTISNAERSKTIPVPANETVKVTVESSFEAVFSPSSAGEESVDAIKLNILDAFGRDVAIYFVDTEPTNESVSKLTSAKVIPFYTFEKWSIVKNSVNNEYTARPIYTFVGAEGMFDISLEGSHYNTYAYNTKVSLSVEGEVPYAWVNKTDEGKYQVVSYLKDYVFYACSDGDYYPVYKDSDGSYRVSNGDILNAENVENILPYDQKIGMTAEEHLKFKLDKQYPFIYNEGTRIVDRANGKYRIYVRFTQGTSKYLAVGVQAQYNDLSGKFNCSNINETCQFMFTLTVDGVQNGESIIFRPYINHWFVYNDKTIDAFYIDEETLTVNE